ncbi:MAG TPA: hypothetical protein PKA37_14670, partial [Planctomycetota bacterium]|jgi:hypothetical protein|nr:hypothetical protein [Planctomycetota bacterium]
MADRYPKEDPLVLALEGDMDALEEVVGSLSAPTFDLAVHLFGASAEGPATEALEHLARTIQNGPPLPAPDPLAIPARFLLDRAPHPPPSGSAFADLRKLDRAVLLLALALDLEGPSLAFALEMEEAQASHHLAQVLLTVASEDDARDRLDEVASRYPLPRGMVDRALENAASEGD